MPEHTDLVKARLHEYTILKEEILFTLRSRVWGVATYGVFAAGALTFAQKVSSPFVWVAPIVFAIPFLWYTAFIELQRVRIAAYIVAVIEPQVPGLEYETSLEKWRHKQHGKKSKTQGVPPYSIRDRFDRYRYIFAMVGVPDIIALYCFCKVVFGAFPWHAIVLAVISFATILHGHLSLSEILSRRKFEEHCSIFQTIGPLAETKKLRYIMRLIEWATYLLCKG